MTLAVIPDPKKDRRLADAAYLRDMADRIESGEVSEYVVVANDKEHKCFVSFASFDDRWRILGALEYAKGGVINSA